MAIMAITTSSSMRVKPLCQKLRPGGGQNAGVRLHILQPLQFLVKVHRAVVYHRSRPEATVRFAAHQSCAHFDLWSAPTEGSWRTTPAGFRGPGAFTRRSNKLLASNASGNRILPHSRLFVRARCKEKTPDD